MGPCRKCRTAYSSIHFAARNGHHKCLSSLLKSGSEQVLMDLDLRDGYGETPLSRAAESGEFKCVKLLLQAGADVNNVAMNGDTPLLAAIERCNINCIDALIQAGACVNGGADDHIGNIPGRDSNIPLVRAAQYGERECMEKLIAAGADVNITAQDGKTALMEAARYGEEKCVEALLEADADVNKKDNLHNFTALIFAAQSRYGDRLACLQLLVWAGAHVNDGGSGLNALQTCLLSDKRAIEDKSAILLLAAGERTDTETRRKILGDNLKEGGLTLKHLCREFIREHLLKIDPHENLFVRVPKFEDLPPTLPDYLLYDVSLDEAEETSETEESSSGESSDYESDPCDDYNKYFTADPFNLDDLTESDDDDSLDYDDYGNDNGGGGGDDNGNGNGGDQNDAAAVVAAAAAIAVVDAAVLFAATAAAAAAFVVADGNNRHGPEMTGDDDVNNGGGDANTSIGDDKDGDGDTNRDDMFLLFADDEADAFNGDDDDDNAMSDDESMGDTCAVRNQDQDAKENERTDDANIDDNKM